MMELSSEPSDDDSHCLTHYTTPSNPFQNYKDIRRHHQHTQNNDIDEDMSIGTASTAVRNGLFRLNHGHKDNSWNNHVDVFLYDSSYPLFNDDDDFFSILTDDVANGARTRRHRVAQYLCVSLLCLTIVIGCLVIVTEVVPTADEPVWRRHFPPGKSSGAPPSLPAVASLLSSSSRAISNTTKNGTVVGAPRYHLSLPPADAAQACGRGNTSTTSVSSRGDHNWEGFTTCKETCHRASCCVDPRPQRNCRTENEEVCGGYALFCHGIAGGWWGKNTTTEKEVIVDDDDERGNVAKQCRNESLVTPEGRQACVVLCQQRRCCFDFGPFNCRSARKEWCQEYDICSNLAAAPPANPEVSENGESQLDRDGN